MNHLFNLMTALGMGAGLMYMFDPEKGNRRRALVRDQVIRASRKLDEAVETTSRDLRNRTHGWRAELQAQLTQRKGVSDEVLAERIRAKLGRFVSHPSAIEVAVQQGRVTLSGPILASEVEWLLKAINSVRGVTAVENHLDVHAAADNVPALQGGALPAALHTPWTPTRRLFMGVAGGLLAFYGLARRGIIGIVLGLLGLGVLARGFTAR